MASDMDGDYDVVILVEQELSSVDARHVDRLRTRAQRILKILARS